MKVPRVESLAEFKSTALAALTDVISARPSQGFSFLDLAAVLGPDFLPGGSRERNLRSWIAGQIKTGLIMKVERGGFIAPGLVEDRNQKNVDLIASVHSAAFQLGAIFKFGEMLEEVSVEYPGCERVLAQVLSASPRYQHGINIKGWQSHWWARDSYRNAIPVPGRLLLIDLQLTASGVKNSGPIEWGMVPLLHTRQARIGLGLKEARMMMRADFELTSVATVAAALEDAILSSVTVIHSRGETRQLSKWWRQEVERLGRPEAILHAWAQLEDATELGRAMMSISTVRFWGAVAKATGLDAASLSRGTPVLDTSVKSFR